MLKSDYFSISRSFREKNDQNIRLVPPFGNSGRWNLFTQILVKQYLIPTTQTFKEGLSIDIAWYVVFQLEILLIKIEEQLWNLQATLEILIASVGNKFPEYHMLGLLNLKI